MKKMSKLQDVRKLKGYTQSELALKANVSKRSIQLYEIGYRSIDGAGLDNLVPLALVLGCKISDLLEDEELISQCKQLGI